MVLVNIKWNKFTYSNISLDITQSLEIFKIQIFSLTGVPPERQKLISKGNWIGTLKDNVDLSTLNIKEGSVIMLMGTADVVIPPVSQITFLEDLNEEEKAVKGTVNPSGLQNLGNTCYMNSTIECLRHMPELREAFNRVYPTGPAQNFTVALRETFNSLDRSTQALPPIEFVVMLRSMFPQFAQTTQQGAYMQQDAEEFYTILIQTLQSGLSSSSSTSTSSALNDLITFEVEETLTCAESSDETPKIHHEVVNKLVCNIQGGAGQNQSNVSVNHLSEGLNLSLNGTLEKYSDVLQRNAIWNKTQKIAKLPKYLCIQFMRFYWKLTPESMDHSGVKCKIMRPVTYTEIFDIYDYCTESLQQKLRISRDIAEKKREEYYNKRTRLLETVSENAPTDDMEVVKESSNESKNETENLPQPPSTTSSTTTLSTTNDSNVDQPIDDIHGLYELVGVVTHKGRSADSGHYIGWVRSNTDHSIWWKYDDDVVTQVTLQDVLNLKGGGDWHTAYLNFYRLRE